MENKWEKRYVDEPESDWWLRSFDSHKTVFKCDDEDHCGTLTTYYKNVGCVYTYSFKSDDIITKIASSEWCDVNSGITVSFII